MAGPLVLVVGAAAGAIFSPAAFSPERCALGDGTTVLGECMLVEDFDTLNTTRWLIEDEFLGPINNNAPELTCVRHENVSIEDGMLVLSMTSSARASCPQTWPADTATYIDNWVSSWPAGQPTSFDAASLNARTFRGKYGRIRFEVKSAGGIGPGPGFALWGEDCLTSTRGILSHYIGGFFAHDPTTNCRFPTRPGSSEIDLWAFRPTDPTWMNFAVYTDNTVGSPPFENSFFGTNYYGDVWGNHVGMTAFLPGAPDPSDPTANFHTIDVDWMEGRIRFYVDGVLYVDQSGAWIPSAKMGPMINMTDVVPVTGATLPQKTYVKKFYWWCPPGYDCTSTP